MDESVGIPRSPSTLLALGSPHPFWNSLREGSKVQIESHYYFNETVEGEETKEEQDDCQSTPLSTYVGHLAQDFARVVIMNDQEIHVGRLILALRSMETKMRKIGQRISANDLNNNISMLENLYEQAPLDKRDSMTALLAYEMDSNVWVAHDRQTGLPDDSGAMGLLWVARNLSYQYHLFKLLLDDPRRNPAEAAKVSFQVHLEPHLSWAVSKLFKTLITALTPRDQSLFFSTVAGPNAVSPEQNKQEVQCLINQWQPLLEIWKQTFAQLGLETI